MRTISALLLLGLSLPVGAALNDTGQTQCLDNAILAPCSEVNAGDSAAYPRQDGRFGRDAQAAKGQLAKVGAGSAGFDFTKVCNSGEAAGIGTCPADPALGAGADDWACTRDNVTGRLWEVKLNDPASLRHSGHRYTWHDGSQGNLGSDTCGGTLSAYSNQCNIYNYRLAINAAQLCGHSDWRVPTRRELLSIVHYGHPGTSYIDHVLFPNGVNAWFWTSDFLITSQYLYGWYVDFGGATSDRIRFLGGRGVRLIRNAQ